MSISIGYHKLPFVAVSVILGLLAAFYSSPYLRHMRALNWCYGVHTLYILSFVYLTT
ncbi:hypothetical protein PYWP30_00848 [Pyrobaculum sp. WP30]|nr:hypothetical protein PYWP30_00848 [Pyrobaculum sp. WP30]